MAVELFDMLKEDHEEVRQIIKHLAETSDQAEKTRQSNFDKLKDELIPHMRAEEQAYYPPLKQRESTRELAEEALEEHHEAEKVLMQIDRLPITDSSWLQRLEELRQKLEHHIAEEEGEVFPASEKELDEARLSEILQQVMRVKEEMKAEVSR